MKKLSTTLLAGLIVATSATPLCGGVEIPAIIKNNPGTSTLWLATFISSGLSGYSFYRDKQAAKAFAKEQEKNPEQPEQPITPTPETLLRKIEKVARIAVPTVFFVSATGMTIRNGRAISPLERRALRRAAIQLRYAGNADQLCALIDTKFTDAATREYVETLMVMKPKEYTKARAAAFEKERQKLATDMKASEQMQALFFSLFPFVDPETFTDGSIEKQVYEFGCTPEGLAPMANLLTAAAGVQPVLAPSGKETFTADLCKRAWVNLNLDELPADASEDYIAHHQQLKALLGNPKKTY